MPFTACVVCHENARSATCTHDACKRCCGVSGTVPCQRHQNRLTAVITAEDVRTPVWARFIGYPTITCGDGTMFDVRSGADAACLPRSSTGPFTHVELFACTGPMALPLELPATHPLVVHHIRWIVDPGCGYDSGAVFHHVPVRVVEDVINFHGGDREHEKEATPAWAQKDGTTDITCADGMELKVHTGARMSCKPDYVRSGSSYTHVQLTVHGDISLFDPHMRMHGTWPPCQSRWNRQKYFNFEYVPVRVVEDAIEYHGGIAAVFCSTRQLARIARDVRDKETRAVFLARNV